MLTLTAIIGVGVLFVLLASLVVFACIRSQRLRGNQSLAPKKIDSTDGRNGVMGSNGANGTVVVDVAPTGDELKINTLNSMEKMMKNTIMKMNGSNQVLTSVVNGGEIPGYLQNGSALPVYAEYDYNYSYPSNDLILANGNVLANNNTALPAYGYDNMYVGTHYIANEYAIQENPLDKVTHSAL